MRIQLLGWKSQGLRSPDIEIALDRDGVVPKLTLLQMPNGTGKTTTLNLIRAALSGEAQDWTGDQVLDLRRRGETNSEGSFLLRMAVDQRPLTIEMSIHFDDKRISYRTTNPGSGGLNKGYKPPPDIFRFLQPKFVALFVFDAELCKTLLDPKHAEAEAAIDALCQLDLFGEISGRAREHWEHATRAQGSAKTSRALANQRSRVEKLGRREERLILSLKDAEKKLLTGTEEAERLTREIAKRIGSTKRQREEWAKLRVKRDDARRDVESLTKALMEIVRCPHTLHPVFVNALSFLKKQFDTLKLPESSSRQFFEELLIQDACICGRPMNGDAKKAIAQKAEGYLGGDMVRILNTLKGDITQLVEGSVARNPAQLDEACRQLRLQVREYETAKTEAQRYEDELTSESEDEVQVMRNKLNSHRDQNENYEELLSSINRDPLEGDDEESMCLRSIRRLLKEARAKLDVVAETVNLGRRTRLLQKIIEQARGIARGQIRESVLLDVNQRLEEVLYRDPVRLKAIERSLVLTQQRGVSTGQMLSIGYLFLSTLLNRGQHKFPLVVDSPANPLDVAHRRRVAPVIAELCDQFLGLTITSERPGFVTELHKASAGNIRYLTLFRKTDGTEKLVAALPSSGVLQSESAALVEGPDYFNAFDLEEEKV